MSIIYGPRSSQLRSPEFEQKLIGFLLDLGPSATLRGDGVFSLIETFCDDGGLIALADGRILDMARAEDGEELVVYDTDGAPVFLEDGVPLVCLDDCFGASLRHTINRICGKLGVSSYRRVSVEHVSRYFWIAVAMKIVDQI